MSADGDRLDPVWRPSREEGVLRESGDTEGGRFMFSLIQQQLITPEREEISSSSQKVYCVSRQREKKRQDDVEAHSPPSVRLF